MTCCLVDVDSRDVNVFFQGSIMLRDCTTETSKFHLAPPTNGFISLNKSKDLSLHLLHFTHNKPQCALLRQTEDEIVHPHKGLMLLFCTLIHAPDMLKNHCLV